jgi:hypothetical protein
MAQAVKPIFNVIDAPIATASGKPLSDDQVKSAIMRAGNSLGWRIVQEKPGLLLATLDIRKHQAVVEIPYSPTKYSISYRSSINLDATPDGQIHRNYSGWIQNLTRAIDTQLAGN